MRNNVNSMKLHKILLHPTIIIKICTPSHTIKGNLKLMISIQSKIKLTLDEERRKINEKYTCKKPIIKCQLNKIL